MRKRHLSPLKSALHESASGVLSRTVTGLVTKPPAVNEMESTVYGAEGGFVILSQVFGPPPVPIQRIIIIIILKERIEGRDFVTKPRARSVCDKTPYANDATRREPLISLGLGFVTAP